ncbi:class II aldolase/adducin family protein [Rhodoplanes sp. Z2-YC6860]|uniref:class II aldolase/adducin family protein n=1 Tax=Rhodoplanes sp. Z2-YC6860 TaxID=674703 RepID=UPI00078B2658|nr:class II aldolase/adducin family protein [Rhodoplanes sp. Z2-YC6860]AMN43964.1 L-ribulose-5-phosphate 4-epimerase [Rhodoplanes sp. Z2-YC6860]
MKDDLQTSLTDLARACRILEMEGHGDMSLGHLSVRDPAGRGFWMKRNRAGLGEILGPDDFVLVDWDGKQIAGSGGRHSEWPIHSEIFRMRADVKVVAHTHPFHACVFSSSLEPLQPFTVDADYFLEVPRHEDDVALITTKEEGAALATTLGQNFAVLMSNHGVTFCGTSVPHATCVGIFLEKACKAQLAGLSAGFQSKSLPQKTRVKRHGQIMTPVHWEHSWNYFCRKLKALGERRDGSPAPLFC